MDQNKKMELWVKITKWMLDAMFIIGIGVTISLPWSIKWISQALPYLMEQYEATVIIYFVLGIAAEKILWELRKILSTVIQKDCFVQQNVVSLQKMSKWSFFIALMSIVRSYVHSSLLMLTVILVFIIAGMSGQVLSFVFAQAVAYKEENDFTI